jgi:hypothetical protein
MKLFNISEEEATNETFGQLLNVEIGHLISELWQNPVIQRTYNHADELQLLDSAKYLFDNIDRISAVDYFPTVDDALRARVPTTGVVEQRFKLEDREFVMFDVGGQRNERRKWIIVLKMSLQSFLLLLWLNTTKSFTRTSPLIDLANQ